MLKVLIDIDGVMANMKRHLEPELHKIAYQRGIKIHCNNNEYSFSHYLGPELTRIFFNDLYDDFIENGDIYEFVSEVTHRLVDICEIHIVTSRGTGDPRQFTAEEVQKKHKHQEDTKKWIEKHNVAYNFLVFTENKIDYINKNKIDIAIEDWLITLLDIKNKTNAKPLCFDQTYNKKARSLGIDVVYSWYDILEKIEGIVNKEN